MRSDGGKLVFMQLTRLAELPQAAREALENAFETASYRAGKPLYDQGDPAERLYAVAEGGVRLFRVDGSGREATVGVAETGSFFGAAALQDGAAYLTYAETISPTRLLSIDRERLAPLWSKYPSIRRFLLAETVKLLRNAQSFYAQMRFADVGPRLARVLLRHMRPGREGIEVNLSHRQIGYLIGANRDTVTRMLGELALAGILEINYRRLVVLDPKALRRLAGKPESGV